MHHFNVQQINQVFWTSNIFQSDKMQLSRQILAEFFLYLWHWKSNKWNSMKIYRIRLDSAKWKWWKTELAKTKLDEWKLNGKFIVGKKAWLETKLEMGSLETDSMVNKVICLENYEITFCLFDIGAFLSLKMEG